MRQLCSLFRHGYASATRKQVSLFLAGCALVSSSYFIFPSLSLVFIPFPFPLPYFAVSFRWKIQRARGPEKRLTDFPLESDPKSKGYGTRPGSRLTGSNVMQTRFHIVEIVCTSLAVSGFAFAFLLDLREFFSRVVTGYPCRILLWPMSARDILSWQLSDCGFYHQHLMTKFAITQLLIQ